MNILNSVVGNSSLGNMSRLKLLLLSSFGILILFQFVIGFRDFEDYLLILIFILFLNDLHFKLKNPSALHQDKDLSKRFAMSIVFLGLFTLPFLFDLFNVSDSIRLTLYKLGFVLWAQIFLIDSFIQYQQTKSKKWLVFANLAVLMIVVGSFVS